MKNKEEVRDIAIRSLSGMPLINNVIGRVQKNNSAEYDTLVRISVTMNRIAVTLGSIFNALRMYVKANEALINKQRYMDLEASRELDQPDGKGGEGEEPVKKALLSNTGKALLGAALLGLMGLLLPEETREKLKTYISTFLMEFDVVKNTVKNFEGTLQKVKESFDSLDEYFNPITKLLTELGLLVGLSLLCMRRGPTTTVPGGPAGRGASRGGGRAGLAAVLAGLVAGAAASDMTEEDESWLDELKKYVKEALSLEEEEPGASSSTLNNSISPNARTAFKFFTSRGYSDEQAAGIVGNLMAESYTTLDIDAFNPIENAYGIAQWRADRLEGLGKQYDKNPRDTTLDEQLRYIEHELNNVSRFKGVKQKLQAAKTSDEAAEIFRDQYEVSKGSLMDRQNFARNILAARQPGATPGTAAPAATEPATPTEAGSSARSILPPPPTPSLQPAAIATPSPGADMATKSVSNSDLRQATGKTSVTNMTAPASVAGAPESKPSTKPRIPSPVIGTPELSMSLLFSPV